MWKAGCYKKTNVFSVMCKFKHLHTYESAAPKIYIAICCLTSRLIAIITNCKFEINCLKCLNFFMNLLGSILYEADKITCLVNSSSMIVLVNSV